MRLPVPASSRGPASPQGPAGAATTAADAGPAARAVLPRRSLLALAAGGAAFGALPAAVLARAASSAPAAGGATRITVTGPAPAGASRDPALHALNRLAFGPAPGDLERVRRQGVAAWINEQLSPERLPLPPALTAHLDGLSTLNLPVRALARYRDLEMNVRREGEAMQRRRTSPGSSARADEPAMAAASGTEPSAREPVTPAVRERREFQKRLAFETASARLQRALYSPRQLEEVMVDFWFDHFNVFENKGLVKVLSGAYERDAIRPHVLGRFRDLLGATAKHPAMLFYLDNWLSVGPDYRPRGKGLTKVTPSGLNENYARELMELHTLGVDGGYSQADVTTLARMLTGWTFVPGNGAGARAQGDELFVFDPDKHDTGAKTWLGRVVTAQGQAEGEWALDVLAAHPATARRIAFKLGRRFVADEPPPELVQHVAQRFQSTQGDIRATLRALFEHPAFVAAAGRSPQYKTPYEYVVSAVRATGLVVTNPRPLMQALEQLGQPVHGCPTPDGWAHTEAAWLNPDAVTRRINIATVLAGGRLPLAAAPEGVAQAADDAPGAAGMTPPGAAMRGTMPRPAPETADVGGSLPPVDAAALLATLGPAISPATRAVIDRSPPALQAALVLGSPDFMRR